MHCYSLSQVSHNLESDNQRSPSDIYILLLSSESTHVTIHYNRKKGKLRFKKFCITSGDVFSIDTNHDKLEFNAMSTTDITIFSSLMGKAKFQQIHEPTYMNYYISQTIAN